MHRSLLLSTMLFLLSLPTFLQAASTVALNIEEPSGVRRICWPVTSGIPLARGVLFEDRSCALFDAAGKEIPLQTEPIARWPDGSIRWLLIDTQVDLSPSEGKTIELRFGEGVRRAAVDNPACALEEGESIKIQTGPLQVKLSADNFRLLDAVWLDADSDGKYSDEERVTGSDGAGIMLMTPDGKTFHADRDKAKLTIEQAGPLRACVRVDGRHTGDDGVMFRYVVRLHAFRGQPFVRMTYTFINDHQESLMAGVDSLDLAFALAKEGSDKCILDGKAGQPGGRIFQLDEAHYLRDGLPVGNRAAGWAATAGDKLGMAVGLREFWQNWPKGIEVSPGRIVLGVCPAFAKGLYDGKPLPEECKLYYYLRDGQYSFKCGVAKTHELWATFFAGQPEVETLATFFQAAENPLLATCEPEYACATKAAGVFPPADPNKFAGYDAAIDRALTEHLALREKVREYGILNYGDWYGERGVNWGNLEYDLAHGLFIQYLRSGDRRFFLRAEQAARHHIDVDVVHATNPLMKKNLWGGGLPRVGDVWLHCVGHTGGYYEDAPLSVERPYQMGNTTNFGHVWASGDLDYYCLTGDRRARDVAVQVADAMVSHIPTKYGTQIRVLSWPMILLMDAYQATGEKKYLDAAARNWEVLKKNIDWDKGWVVRLSRGHCTHGDRRCYGNVAFMEGLTLCALARYHRLTGDPDALRAITVGIDQMIRECWDEEQGAFRYTACTLMKKTFSTTICLAAEALAYESALTGNVEHLRILRKGLREAIGHIRPFGKGFGQATFFTPHALAALEE